MELLRSLIFVPGNRPNMLEKALSFDADVIMVDLEDSVRPAEKVAAMDMAKEWVAQATPQSGRTVMVRVNSLDTGLTGSEVSAYWPGRTCTASASARPSRSGTCGKRTAS